jgi:hypothetical protein
LATLSIAHYLLHTITLDTSRVHVMWVLVVQGIGLGMAIMPIFTLGLAVLPVKHVNAGSAFNNVVQRTASALGIAVLTTIWTTQQAQQMTGRSALLPADTITPHLGDAAVPDWVGTAAIYRLTQLQVFVAGLSDLFLITAALSALGALGALLLRHPATPDTPAAALLPAPTGAPSTPTVNEAAVENLVSPPVTADNGSSPRSADELIDTEVDARPPDK